MTTIGAVLLPQFPPERLPAAAREADDAGLAELWVWEDCFLGGAVACATAALASTTRLRVGVGVLPVPLRNVALAAMEIAAVHRMFPGRAVIGVGHGVQDWMGQVGARVPSPLTLLGEYVTALRALLRGERVDTDGRFVHLDGVRLDWPPTAPVPVLVGSTGPRSLRLSGEVADGTILTDTCDPEAIRRARALVEEGRAAAGRTDAHPVVVDLLTATGPGAADRLAAARDRIGAPASAGVAGDAAAVAEAVARWADAGADTVVLEPTLDEPDPVGFLRFAVSVAALVR